MELVTGVGLDMENINFSKLVPMKSIMFLFDLNPDSFPSSFGAFEQVWK